MRRNSMLCILLAMSMCGCDESSSECKPDDGKACECEKCPACDKECPAEKKCPAEKECPARETCGDDSALGACENYAIKCEDTDSGGVIYQCVKGAWAEQSKCANGVSCHEGVCGECRNADVKCEDRYVEDIADTNCTPDFTGETPTIRCDTKIGAAVGVISTCRNGAWDDQENGELNVCPGHGAEYLGQMNASDYLGDYGPQVRLNHVSCALDGKTCGECNNVFRICNFEENDPDQKGEIWMCNYGKLELSASCPGQCSTLLHCIFSMTDG